MLMMNSMLLTMILIPAPTNNNPKPDDPDFRTQTEDLQKRKKRFWGQTRLGDGRKTRKLFMVGKLQTTTNASNSTPAWSAVWRPRKRKKKTNGR